MIPLYEHMCSCERGFMWIRVYVAIKGQPQASILWAITLIIFFFVCLFCLGLFPIRLELTKEMTVANSRDSSVSTSRCWDCKSWPSLLTPGSADQTQVLMCPWKAFHQLNYSLLATLLSIKIIPQWTTPWTRSFYFIVSVTVSFIIIMFYFFILKELQWHFLINYIIYIIGFRYMLQQDYIPFKNILNFRIQMKSLVQHSLEKKNSLVINIG